MATTEELLRSAGYEYVVAARQPAERPELADVSFEDIHKGFGSTRLRGRRLYKHQLETLRALDSELNVVVVSGTGSGKTEAWFSWVALNASRGRRVTTMVVYPTLSLAWDQMERLNEYSASLGLTVVGVDSLSKKESSGLKRRVMDSWIVVTNPAMLLHELKKHLVKPGSATLSPAFEKLDLLVVDELDFYNPRSLALLLGIIELLAALRGGSLRVAALSATLANPSDLAGFLTKVTGRETRIVRGRPFRAENRIILVLGKNLQALREALAAEARRRGLSLPEEIRKALDNPREFALKAYIVREFFESLGVETPSIGVDAAEILEWFARGVAQPDGLTLAFTRSINEAERLARQLRERLGSDAGRVAAHHHLVPKEERRRIEEAARRGEIRLILTPRTLTQGIDIGSIVRIVHVGLPEEVREFHQREGRKGRREGIPYTESIVIPRGRWDRALLSRGAGALLDWLRLPPERVQVNPGNHYKALLTGSAKLISPLLRSAGLTLDRLEREALESTGVIRQGRVDSGRLQKLWSHLNFYEYGPPYGVKRVLERPSAGRREELEEVSRSDLVEKFQPGCLDPAHDAVVVRLLTSGDRGRAVTRIVEWSVRDALEAREPGWLMEALEEYRHVKEGDWREEARFLADYARGLVESEAITIVYPPRRGFGLLRKVPHRCVWRIASSRIRAVVGADGRVRIYRPTSLVYVDGGVAGEYRDYTYGVVVEAPEGESPELLRLGLAVLGVYLRRVHGVPLGLIKYSVYAVGERRLIEIHEESAAGLLDRLDWASLARSIAGWKPGDIDEVMLLALDEHAYAALEGQGFRWDIAIEKASQVAGLLAARQTLTLRLAGLRVRVPRPSRSLGRAAIAALSHRVEVVGLRIPFKAVAVAYFDGEEVVSAADIMPEVEGAGVRGPPGAFMELEYRALTDTTYGGVTLYAFNPDIEARELERAGLKLLSGLAAKASSVRRALESLGLKAESPSWLADALEVEGGYELEAPRLEELVEPLSRPFKRAKMPEWLSERMKRYVSSYAKLVYLASLAVEKLQSMDRVGRG